MEVVSNLTRSVLSEGRSHQIGFAFCKQVSDTVLETVNPISCCKDYLNDVVYSEVTGKPYRAHGLNTKKEDAFDKGVFLVFKICKYFGGDKYTNYQKDLENINSNILNMLLFINTFEEIFNVEGKTEYLPVEKFTDVDGNTEPVFVFKLPKIWVEYSYLISLYSLLVRISQWYDGKRDVMEYVEKFKEFDEDVYLVKGCLPAIKKIIKDKELPKIEVGKSGNVHNAGISYYAGTIKS